MPTVIESRDIFANIAQKDYFSLFEGKRPRFQQVLGLLDFKKADVAKATEVPLNSVRYDEKMPKELADRIEEWANLLNLVAGHFDGDLNKTTRWFAAQNPMLGNIAPRDMVRFGRYSKLLKFILNAVSGNKR